MTRRVAFCLFCLLLLPVLGASVAVAAGVVDGGDGEGNITVSASITSHWTTAVRWWTARPTTAAITTTNASSTIAAVLKTDRSGAVIA